MGPSVEEARAALHERLLVRRPEIEQTLLTRVYALADHSEAGDPEYAYGLREAVAAALDYGLATVRLGMDRAPQIPAPLLTQARLAARNGIGLDTVLRRYFAGYAFLNDFLLAEAAEAGLMGGGALQHLTRSQAALFDRLVAAVSEEHAREAEDRPDSTGRRRSERVRRLLDGELVDGSELGYDFDLWHLGAIAAGTGAEEATRELAASIDCRLLMVKRDEDAVWAWLGSRRRIDPATLEAPGSADLPPGMALSIGEPGHGLPGWRLTHQQARAALPIAQRSPGGMTPYADVALLASMLQDDLLATSLRERYLVPLRRDRDGGEVARQTLRAYFAANRNVSSAAAALGVNRNTVANRLRAIEASVAAPLSACASELEAALRLEELDSFPSPPASLAVR